MRKNINRTTRVYFVLLIFLMLICKNASFGSQIFNGCFEPFPIFSKYKCAGLFKMKNENHVILSLVANQHDSCNDCIAPDCYGTIIEIDIQLLRIKGKCLIKSAQVTLEDYENNCFSDFKGKTIQYSNDMQFLNEKDKDLCSSALKQLVFVNKKRTKAVVVGPESFVYIDELRDDGDLRISDDNCRLGVIPSPGSFSIVDKYRYSVQVFAISNEKIAKEHFKRLFDDGFRPYVRKFETKGNIFYRIRAGRGTKSDARKLKQQIENKYGLSNTLIVKGDEYFDRHLIEYNINIYEKWSNMK